MRCCSYGNYEIRIRKLSGAFDGIKKKYFMGYIGTGQACGGNKEVLGSNLKKSPYDRENLFT